MLQHNSRVSLLNVTDELSNAHKVELMHMRNHLPNPTRTLALAGFLLILSALAWGQQEGA